MIEESTDWIIHVKFLDPIRIKHRNTTYIFDTREEAVTLGKGLRLHDPCVVNLEKRTARSEFERID